MKTIGKKFGDKYFNSTFSVLLSALFLAVLLGACASAPGTETAQYRPLTNKERYILTVEKSAQRNNAAVTWVNVPDDDDVDEYVAETDSAN